MQADISHILLIDDDPHDRELASVVFEELAQETDQPVRVQLAASGQEALDHLFDAAQPLPNVVLLDLNMPQMNGGAVLAAIRADERTARLPVVILSTSREPRDIQSCYAQGANAYVVKSLDYSDFRCTLQSVLDFWVGRNRVPHIG